MSDLKTFAVIIRNTADWRDSYELRFQALDEQDAEAIADNEIGNDPCKYVGTIEQIEP